MGILDIELDGIKHHEDLCLYLFLRVDAFNKN